MCPEDHRNTILGCQVVPRFGSSCWRGPLGDGCELSTPIQDGSVQPTRHRHIGRHQDVGVLNLVRRRLALFDHCFQLRTFFCRERKHVLLLHTSSPSNRPGFDGGVGSRRHVPKVNCYEPLGWDDIPD